MSSKGHKFVIHVPSEYDYMFSQAKLSKLIIKTIAMAKIVFVLSEKTFRIFTHDLEELKPYVRTKDDMNYQRQPNKLRNCKPDVILKFVTSIS